MLQTDILKYLLKNHRTSVDSAELISRLAYEVGADLQDVATAVEVMKKNGQLGIKNAEQHGRPMRLIWATTKTLPIDVNILAPVKTLDLPKDSESPIELKSSRAPRRDGILAEMLFFLENAGDWVYGKVLSEKYGRNFHANIFYVVKSGVVEIRNEGWGKRYYRLSPGITAAEYLDGAQARMRQKIKPERSDEANNRQALDSLLQSLTPKQIDLACKVLTLLFVEQKSGVVHG